MAGAVDVAPWDDVLAAADDELAHLGIEPAREAELVDLPPGLHPRVAQALAARASTGCTRTRRTPGWRRPRAAT